MFMVHIDEDICVCHVILFVEVFLEFPLFFLSPDCSLIQLLHQSLQTVGK